MKIEKQNLDTFAKDVEIKFRKKDQRKKIKMKVSGASVKKLNKIIANK